MTKTQLTKSMLLSFLATLAVTCTTAPKADYPAAPVPFTAVHLTDAFWAPRLETNRAVTIPHNFKVAEETKRVKNFELAAEAQAGAKDLKFCTALSLSTIPTSTRPSRRPPTRWRPVPTRSWRSTSTGSSPRSPPPRSRTATSTRSRTIGGPPPAELAGQGALVEPLHEPRAL